MASTKKDRKWVIRAMIAFVVILALLTFFSNTIMNATIPKVTGTYPVRGNLSYTNNATSVVEIENKTDVKGIEGREVDKVLLGDYDSVSKGDVVITLKTLENQSELDELEKQLSDLKKEAEYEARTPKDPTDYTSLSEGVVSANRTLSDARTTLAAAQNKDATIAAAQKVINDNKASVVAYEAQVSSASDTLESINAEISEHESSIKTLDSQINIFVTLGTPTPTPYDPSLPTDGEQESDKDTTQIDDLCAQKAELEARIEELELQKEDAENRLSTASANLAEVNSIIEDAQAKIEEAEALPTVGEAQSAVNLAQSGVSEAQRAYSNAQINDGIARDQAQDAIDNRNKQMEDLEEQIEKLEKKINATEIVAPCDGYIYGMSVLDGDTLNDEVIFTIIPYEPVCTVSFTFSAKAAENLYVNMELSTDNYWVNKCIITNIKPDPQDPRESRVVKCSIVSDYMYPGESITATADRSNATYDTVVPSSAINEDNSGQFVYVIEESSSPLGDKYVVKRVNISSVEATDGAQSAIKAEDLGDGMVVTRSEKPLHDGDRVRLEDYSKDNKDNK